MKLGMDGPGHREAKAALSVPPEVSWCKHQPLQQVPMPEVTAEMLWGGVCVLLPWKKIMGPGKATPGKLRDPSTLLHADLDHHIHGKEGFLQALLLLLVLTGTTWRAYKPRVPPGTNRQLTWQLHANRCWETALLAQLLEQATDPALLLNVHFMWTSSRKADICNHSALLLRREGMALQALLRQQAGFKAKFRVWDRRSLFLLNHICKNNFWAFTLVQFHFKALLLSSSPRLGEGHALGQQSHPRGSRLSKQLCFVELEAPNWGKQGPEAACKAAERFRKLWYHHWAIRAVPQDVPSVLPGWWWIDTHSHWPTLEGFMSHTLKKKSFSNEQAAVTEMEILHEILSKSLWLFEYKDVLLT